MISEPNQLFCAFFQLRNVEFYFIVVLNNDIKEIYYILCVHNDFRNKQTNKQTNIENKRTKNKSNIKIHAEFVQ